MKFGYVCSNIFETPLSQIGEFLRIFETPPTQIGPWAKIFETPPDELVAGGDLKQRGRSLSGLSAENQKVSKSKNPPNFWSFWSYTFIFGEYGAYFIYKI